MDIKQIIQDAWNDGERRKVDTFGAFLDAAAEKVKSAFNTELEDILNSIDAGCDAVDKIQELRKRLTN
jgi:hypothetical protein